MSSGSRAFEKKCPSHNQRIDILSHCGRSIIIFKLRSELLLIFASSKGILTIYRLYRLVFFFPSDFTFRFIILIFIYGFTSAAQIR